MSKLLTAALTEMKSFGYGKDQAGFWYHHFVELEHHGDAIKCTLFLHTGNNHKSHEFETTLDELLEFMLKKGEFHTKLVSEAMLGEIKMCENWPVDVESLRVGLMKNVRHVLCSELGSLSDDIWHIEKQGVDLHQELAAHGFRAV